MLITVLTYIIYVVWSLYFRYWRIVEKDDGLFYIQTMSYLMPFLWHSKIWDINGERGISNPSLKFYTLQQARNWFVNTGISITRPKIIKTHPIREVKERDYSYLLDGITDETELKVMKSIIEKKYIK